MFKPKSLDACPICRAVIPSTDRRSTCPSCGTNLTPYYELLDKANELYFEAMDAVSRLNFEVAEELARKMVTVNPYFKEEAVILSSLTSLYQHKFEEAYALALSLPPGHYARSELLSEIENLYQVELKGKQHYNLSLASARNNLWKDADYHIQKALEFIPYLPEPWRLAVKLAIAVEDYDTALSRLDEALKAFPNDSFLLAMQAELKN